MFNLETISLFTQHFTKSEKINVEAIEKAQSELKRYECFSKLLNNKEDLFNQCKDIILKDILTSTRSNTKINRDYLLGYQDAIEVFIKYLGRYNTAMDKLNSKGE